MLKTEFPSRPATVLGGPEADTVIDPPLGESDTPLMANPVLSRRPVRRGGALGWYVGVPLAIVALGAVAAGIAVQNHPSSSLVASSDQSPPAQQVATAPPPVAVQPQPAPIATTETPVAAPVVASNDEARLDEARLHHRLAARRAAARDAEDSGADASVVAPTASTPPPAPPVQAPVVAAQPAAPAAPAAPPVITPPAAGQ